MQASHFGQMQGLLDPGYVQQAEQGFNSLSKKIMVLLTQRKLPKEPWTDLEIESFLRQISLMDANNANGNVGVGEREGRVFSRLVQERHFGLTHGVGRSGDLVAQQPKAAGSSLLASLCKYLALDAVRLAGFKNCKNALVVPLATGMTMTLCFLALQQRDTTKDRKFVIWSRIDQKSCFKAINTSGLTPIVVELIKTPSGDGLMTDVAGIEQAIEDFGADNILCVFCTASTFAPRVPDKIEEVAKICQKHDVAFLINNAYGLQCSRTMQAIEQASRTGRVDVVVQSTDKNFMVPVGGAIVCAPQERPPVMKSGGGGGGPQVVEDVSKNAGAGAASANSTTSNPPSTANKLSLLDQIAQCYPGRASGAQMVDLLITFLAMGSDGLQNLWKTRKTDFEWFKEELQKTCDQFKLRILHTPENKISICVDLSGLVTATDVPGGDGAIVAEAEKKRKQVLNSIGAKLFNHRVSGPRVVACPVGAKTIDGVQFKNYGAHSDTYPYPYLATAVAIGATRAELTCFLQRLEKTLKETVTSSCVQPGSDKTTSKQEDKI
ncbi:unnamed protein product [Amoebophrya sp. A120]|nr:unnamed protein product [Amoebophrya sp. A120]|eukprot:GSA120T00011110001.1